MGWLNLQDFDLQWTAKETVPAPYLNVQSKNLVLK
jgi:hypothetical protein